MNEDSKIHGHAIISGGCPFHRAAASRRLTAGAGCQRRPSRAATTSGAASAGDDGPIVTDFTRLFPDLRASLFDVSDIRSLTLPGGPMDIATTGKQPQDNPTIPAGFTFLGQFLDHDITFDVFSNIRTTGVNPDQTRDSETPTFDLSNVYGRGPVLDAFLYQKDGATLVYGTADNPDYDVCRNAVGTAIIGDPRNDDNLLVCQIQLAMIKFNNQVVKDLADKYSGPDLFVEASRIVRWHYQWMVYNDFLPRFIGQDLFKKIVDQGPQYYTETDLRIPIEFAAAAYRMGHATVRQTYQINTAVTDQQIFDLHIPGTFVPAASRVDWKYFFNTDTGWQPQASKALDTLLATELLTLPAAAIPGFEPSTDPLYLSLAGRNLLRQNEFNLPAGQTIAKTLGEAQYTNAQLGLPSSWNSDVAPLWYYVLKEAQLANKGYFLGAVGGRIVGEVFIGILLNDPASFLNNHGWKPSYGTNGNFTMADLLNIADAYTPK